MRLLIWSAAVYVSWGTQTCDRLWKNALRVAATCVSSLLLETHGRGDESSAPVTWLHPNIHTWTHGDCSPAALPSKHRIGGFTNCDPPPSVVSPWWLQPWHSWTRDCFRQCKHTLNGTNTKTSAHLHPDAPFFTDCRLLLTWPHNQSSLKLRIPCMCNYMLNRMKTFERLRLSSRKLAW